MKKLICMMLCVCLFIGCLPGGTAVFAATGDEQIVLMVGETEEMSLDYGYFVDSIRADYPEGDLEFVCTVRVSNGSVADVEFTGEGSSHAEWTVTGLRGGTCTLSVSVEAFSGEELIGRMDAPSANITVVGEEEEEEEELEIDIPRILIVDEEGNEISDKEAIPVGESRGLSFMTVDNIIWRQGTIETEEGVIRGTLGFDTDGGCYYILSDGVEWSKKDDEGCLTLWETEDRTEVLAESKKKGMSTVSVMVEFGYAANWDNELVDLGYIGTAKATAKIKTGSLLENPFEDIDVSKVKNPFEDVSEKDWSYEYMMKMYAAGLFEGILLDDGTVYYSDGVKQLSAATGPVLQQLSYQEPFALMLLANQGNNIGKTAAESRGNMVKYLCDAAKVAPASYSVNPFADVTSGLPFYHHVLWANATGIVNGYGNGNFGPKDSITREQFCTIMLRYAKKYGVSLTAKVAATPFADAGSVSGYAKDAVTTLQKAGIINGIGGNRFAPKALITREQVSKMVVEFFTNFA